MSVFGFLNLNKPAGWTSHDCVAKVRRLLQMKRVGHGGTLDPAATGVLPIALGRATRLLPFLPPEKAYRARCRLGVRTTTDDLEGETISCPPVPPSLELADVRAALQQFVGRIEQIPPVYSAIQRDGQRLYARARAGETDIAVPPRQVEVQKIAIIRWLPGLEPELEFDITCGPGTYIRAIARDLGTALGTGGTLAALTRTRSCGFDLSKSTTLEALAATTTLEAIAFEPIPPTIALRNLPQCPLAESAVRPWRQGRAMRLAEATN
ncbi:MAG: tRNA pseudouridine(55) synthase TruB, partial [Cyanobacteria bacterium J06641_5]